MRRALFAVVAVLVGCSSSIPAAGPRVDPTVDDMVRNVALDGVRNVRDLGGLRGSHGFIPHEHFYRAATLVHASSADRELLHERGITLDIDLRTSFETDFKGDRLSDDARFSYRHISLFGVGIEDWFRAGDLRRLYLHALDEHQGGFRAVFHAIATHEGGAVLYHCTSGKDRTGMVTAILLDLAGVERGAIVRDYAISAHYDHLALSASPPAAIRAFLDALHAEYGGARAYLTRIGLSANDVRSLLAKLGQG